MATSDKPYSKRTAIMSLLAALALTLMLTPTLAVSAERDGSTLFFSFEDLTQGLHRSIPSLLYPRSAFQPPKDQTNQDSPIEQRYRWGNGLGFDSYAYPGTRQPLWGY
jgi:hypothetical protein